MYISVFFSVNTFYLVELVHKIKHAQQWLSSDLCPIWLEMAEITQLPGYEDPMNMILSRLIQRLKVKVKPYNRQEVPGKV